MKPLLIGCASLLAGLTAAAAPMSTANRTTGVAPLAVFFDAVNAGNQVIAPALVPQPYGYADLNFEWSFGDDPSARWSMTGRSKDEAFGFVAGHVYELPGVYGVTLRVTMPDGLVQNFEQTITVSDPNVVYANSSNDMAERTWYVSALGSDSNSGSFNRPFRTLGRGLTRLFSANGPRRLLLRRGESFAGGGGIYVNGRTGPYTIGSYGTGADPVVTFSAISNGASLHFSQSTSDVRIVGLDIIGPTLGHAITPGVNTLVLRTDISRASSGISTSDVNGNKAGSFIVESVITNSENYGIYYNFGAHVAVMGNVLDTVFQEHVMRCYLTHSVIQQNVFRGGANAKHQLKFVGYHPSGNPDREAGTPTEEVEYSIISENLFEESGPVSWMITVGPTDSSKDQRLSNVIFERNVLRAGLNASDMLYLNNSLVTVRNNVFDSTESTPNTTAVRVTRRGVEPPPFAHRILHNTMYTGDAEELVAVQVDNPAQGIVVRNNLVSGENVSILLGGGTALEAERNLSDCDAGFVDAPRGDFTLLPGSPAIDRGALVPSVFTDFAGVPRPVDGDASGSAERDVGAFEYSPLRNLKRRATLTQGPR